MRDHTRLRAFHLADELAMRVYECSSTFPTSERFGLTSQARRAAVSVVANIVEGSARFSEAEYVRFLEVAYGSARELQYEISLCARLGFLHGEAGDDLTRQCTETAKSLGARSGRCAEAGSRGRKAMGDGQAAKLRPAADSPLPTAFHPCPLSDQSIDWRCLAEPQK